jgi:hypothetical protein
MNTGAHDELTRDLEREADQFARRGGTTLDISQVLDRAGEIRRGRRMRATMVMAACVLAIAVPTVLVAVNRDTTHEPTPAPAPKVDSSPLSLAGLETGPAPRAGYFEGNRLHNGPEVEAFAGNTPVRGFAGFRGGVVVATQDANGDLRARLFDDSRSWPMSGDFAVSDGGHVVAFVQPDGVPVVVQVDDQGDHQVSYDLPKIPRGSGFDAVAVTGEQCQEEGPNTCDVLVTSHGEKPESWVSSSTGHLGVHEQLSNVVAAFGHKLLAGFTEVTDAGSCSVVKNVEHVETGSPSWTTCEHRFLSFSPDGQRLLASAAYADGLGDSELTLLDSDTGRSVLDLRTADQAALTQMVWEDDRHVLARVYEQGRWAVLRIGLDGSREYAVAPVTGEDVDAPFVLPSR